MHESKGNRGWILVVPFCRDVAQPVQAAVLGLASYRRRAKLVFSQSERCLHLLWSLRVTELRVCHAIDEFHSLQRTQCRFDEKSLNSFQGQAEETLMSQVLCHLAVMSIELVQSNPCALESKSNRGWIFTVTFCGIAACASSGARIGILRTKGQAFVFANRTLPALHMGFRGKEAEGMSCHRRILQSAKNTMPVGREISQQLSRSS